MGAYKHLTTVNLAQARNFRLSEIENREYFEFSLKLAHLAQARGLRSSEHSKLKGGELLPFSLRQELPVWARNSSLRRE